MKDLYSNKQRMILVLLYLVSFFLFCVSVDCISAPEDIPLSQKLICFYSVWLIGRLSNFKLF
jgi:hypothetical protein